MLKPPTGTQLAHLDDHPSDPVHRDAWGWWFWDETWSNRHGPFPDEAAARAALDRYCDEVLG